MRAIRIVGIIVGLCSVSNVNSLSCYSCTTPVSAKAWDSMKDAAKLPKTEPTIGCASNFKGIEEGIARKCKYKCVSVVSKDKEQNLMARGCLMDMVKPGIWKTIGINPSDLFDICVNKQMMSMFGITGAMANLIPETGELCVCGTNKCNNKKHTDLQLPPDALMSIAEMKGEEPPPKQTASTVKNSDTDRKSTKSPASLSTAKETQTKSATSTTKKPTTTLEASTTEEPKKGKAKRQAGTPVKKKKKKKKKPVETKTKKKKKKKKKTTTTAAPTRRTTIKLEGTNTTWSPYRKQRDHVLPIDCTKKVQLEMDQSNIPFGLRCPQKIPTEKEATRQFPGVPSHLQPIAMQNFGESGGNEEFDPLGIPSWVIATTTGLFFLSILVSLTLYSRRYENEKERLEKELENTTKIAKQQIISVNDL